MFQDEPIVSPGHHPSGWGLDDAAMYGYGGQATNQIEDKFEVGAGFYKGDNFDLWDGSAEAGVFSPNEHDSQLGIRGDAQSIGAKASLGDLMELVTLGAADTMEGNQGGVSNFLEGEVHGPRASGELSAGEAGINVGAGAEAAGASAKLGGAEYDWFGGTEISVGGGIEGVGANGGLSWSDDDGDGYREYGFSLGGRLGIGGVDVGIKSEIPGYLADLFMGSTPDTGECEP